MPAAAMRLRRFGIHERAAARRQHLAALVEQPRDHAALAVAEIGLAIFCEYLVDGLAGGQLDFLVGVGERACRASRPAACRWPTCRRP